DEVREFYRGLWRGIPNVKLTLLNRVDADDCVVEESEIFGRMEGPLFGVEPSGADLRYRVVIFFPVRDALFSGERVYFDLAEFARQVPAARALLASPARCGSASATRSCRETGGWRVVLHRCLC